MEKVFQFGMVSEVVSSIHRRGHGCQWATVDEGRESDTTVNSDDAFAGAQKWWQALVVDGDDAIGNAKMLRKSADFFSIFGVAAIHGMMFEDQFCIWGSAMDKGSDGFTNELGDRSIATVDADLAIAVNLQNGEEIRRGVGRGQALFDATFTPTEDRFADKGADPVKPIADRTVGAMVTIVRISVGKKMLGNISGNGKGGLETCWANVVDFFRCD